MAAVGSGHDMVLRMLADTNQYLREIRKAQTATHAFRDAVAGAARFIRDTMSTAFGVMGGNVLTGAISGITSHIGNWVRTGFELNSVLIQSRESFGVMFGSVREGNGLVAELYQYAAKTVYEFENINKAASSLAASGIGSAQILPVLRVLGELGNTSTRPIEEIAALYGKVRSGGRITGEEMRQFTHLGIPLIGELARVMGVSKSELRDLVEHGRVGFTQFPVAMQNMTAQGGQFYEMQKKLALTVPGIWATLKDSFKMASAQLAESIIEIFDLKEMMKSGIRLGDWMNQIIQQWTPTIKAWWEWFRAEAANTFWDLTAKALEFAASFLDGVAAVGKQIQGILDAITFVIKETKAFFDYIDQKDTRAKKDKFAASVASWITGKPAAETVTSGAVLAPAPKPDASVVAAAKLRELAAAAGAKIGSGRFLPEPGLPNLGPEPPQWPMRIEPGQTGKPVKEKEEKDRDILAKALSGKDAYQAIYDAMKEQANAERQEEIRKNTADTAEACKATAARMEQVAENMNLLTEGITAGAM